jgi:hypothetical protein
MSILLYACYMGKVQLTSRQIRRLTGLRQTGHSLPEIRQITGHASSTVWKYIKDVSVSPRYRKILHIKQGGSKERARRRWSNAAEKAKEEIGAALSRRDRLLVLAALYWGEGNKRELNMINGSPLLLKTFLESLYCLGVVSADIRFSIRVFGRKNLKKTKDFWQRTLELTDANYVGCEILDGKKDGKLEYGMCRVRMVKSEQIFKLIMSMIDLIGTHHSPRSSMDRVSHS